MTRTLVLRAFGALMLASQLSSAKAGTPAAPQRPVFEPNEGQFIQVDGAPAPDAFLRAEGHGMAMYVTRTGLTYVFAQEATDAAEARKKKHDPLEDRMRAERDPVKLEMAWAHMRLEGASIRAENIVLEEEGTARYDYYTKNRPQGVSVHRYGRVTVREVYPGIDWVLYNNGDGLKYDFIVRPEGDARAISMLYHSASPVTVDAKGAVHISTKLGELTEQPPVAWYEDNGARVTCRFGSARVDDHRVRIRFELSPGKRTDATLVIDPELTWATFTFAETGGSNPHTVRTKSNGDVILAGYGGAVGSFPVPFDTLAFSGAYTFDAGSGYGFIQAFNSAGVLLWSTFYDALDQLLQMEIDANDRILISGRGYENMPTQAGTGSFSGAFYQPTLSGATLDGIILAFSPNGVREWATFLGGTYISGIATSATGRIVLSGQTDSAPGLDQVGTGSFAGAFHQTPVADAGYLIGFEPNGALAWASGFPIALYKPASLAFRPSGDFVLVTNAYSGAPTLATGAFSGAMVNGITGVMDGYIAGFTSNGEQIWGSYFPMGDNDVYDEASMIQGLVVGADDRIVVMGSGVSPTLETMATGIFAGAYQHSAPGVNSSDVYLYGFSPAGQMHWRTQMGGDAAATEYSASNQQLAMDACGNLFAAFAIVTYSSGDLVNAQWLATCDSYLDGVQADGDVNNSFSPDAMLMRFDANGVLTWSTLYGGNWIEEWMPITTSPQGEFYVVGDSEGQGFHTLDPGNGAWYTDDATVQNSGGLYILRFSPTACDGPGCTPYSATATSENISCAGGCDGTATATPLNGAAPYTYLWDNGQTTPSATGLCAGVHTAIITDATGTAITASVSIAQPPPIDVLFFTVPSECLEPTGVLGINMISGGTTNGLGAEGFSYAWSHSNLDTNYFEGVPPGAYVLTSTDLNGCTAMDTAYIPQATQPTVEVSVTDSVLGAGENAQLTASGAISYTWSPAAGLSCVNCASPTATPNDTTTYCVIGLDLNGCTDTVCVNISATPPCTGIYVPTAFSPDGSTKNDLHCVYGNCIGSLNMSIYDRWGKLVFESDQAASCWDGTFEGKALTSGVFVYHLTAVLTDGRAVEQQGNITLLR
ncbi:MAG TPA: gliding motility-associated C-terminal domain-containing protein [Flavobacteriales bacterium]